jgi:hypothetical protein
MPAFASVPFAGNCTVAFYGNPAAGIICVCPQGDWNKLDVTCWTSWLADRRELDGYFAWLRCALTRSAALPARPAT